MLEKIDSKKIVTKKNQKFKFKKKKKIKKIIFLPQIKFFLGKINKIQQTND